MNELMEQAVQLVGAFLMLGAFAALQMGRLRVDSPRYLLMNACGSGMLLIIAILDREWGFILLESVWTGVSLIALARLKLRPAFT